MEKDRINKSKLNDLKNKELKLRKRLVLLELSGSNGQLSDTSTKKKVRRELAKVLYFISNFTINK